MEKLFESGAKDVFFTPIQMKKNRPATMLSVICDDTKVAEAEHIIFSETSTIGLRKYGVKRSCLPRKTLTISTPYGDVKAKESIYGGEVRITLEYDDARRVAKEKHIALQEVYEAINRKVW
jgi:uncharacterized protein (DUF111 family)